MKTHGLAVRIAITKDEEARAVKAVSEMFGNTVTLRRETPDVMLIEPTERYEEMATIKLLLAKVDAFLCGLLWTR